MKKILFTLLAVAAAPVFAQTDDGVHGFAHRDTSQQQRIEQGLQSGALTTREAAGLEREQSRIDQMESRALRNGNLSAAERALYQHRAEPGKPGHFARETRRADWQSQLGVVAAHAGRRSAQHQPGTAHPARHGFRSADQS